MSESPDNKPPRKLTPKQERFCQLYTTHWQAARAARDAGYSQKTCGIQGYQLLQIPLVKARISELTEPALKELGCTRERILAELAALSFYDLSDACDEIGQLKPIKEMPANLRRAVSKVRVHELFAGQGEEKTVIGFTKEIEFTPKKGAIDSLTKILGLAPDKLEHSGPGGKPIEHKSLSDLPDEALDERIRALLGAAKPDPSPTE